MSITLNTIASGYNLSVLNSNMQRVQEVLNNEVVWRKGTTAGETLMERDLDMNSHSILNLHTNMDDPNSLLTVEDGDTRYYNVAGDSLEGPMDANGNRVTGLPAAVASSEPVRLNEFVGEVAERQAGDDYLQSQISGGVPLAASAFSVISWHGQEVQGNISIPDNKNAWSFGPEVAIISGASVTIGTNSYWTIANGVVT